MAKAPAAPGILIGASEQVPDRDKEWSVTSLKPDPRNAEIFDPLDGQDLSDLVQSLRDNGMINPISIRKNGVIIAGEQRWRAAQLAGLKKVPVRIWDISDEQAEWLRIEENLRRRNLKTHEIVRAVRRLYVIFGIPEQGGRPAKDKPENGDNLVGTTRLSGVPTRADIANAMGKSQETVTHLNTLANLVPGLMGRLDRKEITQEAALQLAQMPEGIQREIDATFTSAELKSVPELQTLKATIKRIEAANAHQPASKKPPVAVPVVDAEARVAEMQARLATEVEQAAAEARDKARAEMSVEIEAMRERWRIAEAEKAKALAAKDEEIGRLHHDKEVAARDQSRAEVWAKRDAVHRMFTRIDQTIMVDARACARDNAAFGGITKFLEDDLATAEAAIAWMRDYADEMRIRLGMQQKSGTNLRRVPS